MKNLIILSAPSGSGKTTLAKRFKKENRIKFSVSHTSRKIDQMKKWN